MSDRQPIDIPKPSAEQLEYLRRVFDECERAKQYDPEYVIGPPSSKPNKAGA